jgi:polyphosphate glucokinase
VAKEARVHILGIDVGASGIKGAPVDTATGSLLAERYRIPTPQPSEPPAVARVVREIVEHFGWRGPIGCTFPAVIKAGIVRSAANVDKRWIGTDGQTLFEDATGCPVTLLNDADAAGIAEMTFGSGRGRQGVVMVLTFGTGIGSALFVNQQLLPNTELGHLEIRGKDAEERASERAREKRGYSWSEWAEKVNEFLGRLDALFSPDLYVVGGGASKHHDQFLHLLTPQAEVVPAQLLNDAGIVGAALAAQIVMRATAADVPVPESLRASVATSDINDDFAASATP